MPASDCKLRWSPRASQCRCKNGRGLGPALSSGTRPRRRGNPAFTNRSQLSHASTSPGRRRRRTFFGRVEEEVAGLPGVTNVALAGAFPLNGGLNTVTIRVEDQPVPEGETLPRVGVRVSCSATASPSPAPAWSSAC